MLIKKKTADFVTWALIAGGGLACLRAAYYFPLAQADFRLGALVLVTILFGSRLQIQIPKTKIHFSIADALVFLSLLLYGGALAVLLATAEALYTSTQFKYKGINIKTRTIVLNAAIAALTTSVTALAANYFFAPLAETIKHGETNTFVKLVALIVVTQFVCNSALVAFFAAEKTNQPFTRVWHEHCTNTFVIYLACALFASFMLRVAQGFDLLQLLAGLVVVGITYATYRRYVDDIRRTSAQAEQAERERAEQAEKHIEELNHFIAEQERISNALRESKEKFRHAAFHDELTDLPNRPLFIAKLSQLLAPDEEPGARFAVLFLDLNRFKTINESLGHTVGDALLCLVAQRLSRAIREGDVLARFSSDEFGIILHDVAEVAEAETLATRLAQKISVPFTLDGRQIFTSLTIGIACPDQDYANPEDVLRDANIAMCFAKEKKQEHAVFDRSMYAKSVNLLELETDLRHAVKRQEFLVYYQPIVALTDGSLVGFEALMRWQHPQRGLVSPLEFIPLSEDTGLIIPMTLWLLRDACSQLSRWSWLAPSYQTLILSVNLSSRHFAQPDLAKQVAQILRETGFPSNRLKLEITESVVMENAELTIELLLQLKEIGVQLSIDDFGTGYSSLSYLHRFPIDTLKIDRSFISTMGQGLENREIVQTIISLAKNLGMDVVAEGIETPEQCQRLRNLDCEYAQGFLFSRPLPQEDATKLLKEKKTWITNWPALTYENTAASADRPRLRLAQ